jgi:LysR family glycine cleavage system transcriptional activator
MTGCDASAATRRAWRRPCARRFSVRAGVAEQGHGIALARWSLVAGDLASGRLVRPSSQSVRQRNSYYFVAPPHHFELPKVIRFRDWLREVCGQFPPPEGERLEP